MSASNPDKKIVLLAGASGSLGGLIARALLEKPGVTLRCLARPGSEGKLAPLAAKGAEVVQGDLGPGGEAALAKAAQGVWAVVSAVQGGPDVIVDGQLRLLRAALGARARRFILSDYSFDLFNLAEGDNINSDWRRRFAREAEQEAKGAIEVVHVLNGAFLDKKVLFGFMGMFDLGAGVARVWGDGGQKMDFTTYEDTARYTAEAAVDPEKLPSKLNVAGDSLTFHELVRAYEETSGKKITVQRQGSLDELAAETARRQRENPANMYAYLPLMYYRAMLNGKGKLGALANGRYPHIKPTTVREYVKREGL